MGLPEPKIVTIGAFRYRIYLLDATKGYPIFVKLLRALGPALSGLSTQDPVAALGALLRSLEVELVAELTSVFGSSSDVEIDGKWPQVKAVFALHFAGKYVHMIEWLVECCKHNFSDFLDAGSLTSALGLKANTST